MGTYKTNEYGPFVEEDHGHQSVMIPFDVEDVVVVTHVIDGVERLFDISQWLPVRSFNDSIPVVEGSNRAGVLKTELIKNCFADNDHWYLLDNEVKIRYFCYIK